MAITKTIEIPKTYYSIEIFPAPDKSSLKVFKDQMSKSLKEFNKEVVYEDSLFKFHIGPFKSEERAVMLKNGPKIQTLNDGSSVVSYNNKVPSGLSPKFSLTFPVRFTVSMQNNVLNTTWFNKYIGANMIEDISRIFGLNQTQFNSLKESRKSSDKLNPYVVLESNPEDNIADIRKKYIKLSKEHHPDLLLSKGVPVEVIEESKKKMRAINSAWDQIQKLKAN